MKGSRQCCPLLDALHEVLDCPVVAYCCTLKELHLLVAEKLPEEERVSYADFQRLYQEGMRDADHVGHERAYALYNMIARARLNQKLELYKGYREKTDWRKYQWLLETKFADFDSKTRNDFQEKQPMPDLVYTSRLIDADEEEDY